MAFQLVTKKFIEEGGEINELACVYTHIPEDADILHMRGHLYTMVNMKLPEGADAINGVNQFLDKLEEGYFSSQLIPFPTVLEKAVKDALFVLDSYFTTQGIDGEIIFDFACAAIKEDILYIAKVEDGFIYLIRDNKAIDLSRSLKDVSNPKLVENGSGVLMLGDKVILANKAADSLISDWNLLSRYTEAEMNRLISPNKTGEDKLAFIVIELEEDANLRESLAEQEDERISPILEYPGENRIDSTDANTEVPSPGADSKGQSFVGKMLDLNDKLAAKAIGLLQLLGYQIKRGAGYIYAHRKEIIAFVANIFQQGWKYLLLGKSKILKEQQPLRRMVPDASEGKPESLVAPRRRVTKMPLKDRRIIVPVVILACGFFLSVFH